MNANLRAGVVMIAAMIMLTGNDAVIKHVGQSLAVGQVLLFRGLMVMAIFAVAILASGMPLVSRQLLERWTLVRGAFEVSATACFLSALVLLPLAVASSLVFVSPIFITLVAAVMPGERVGWRRITAVLVGFAGSALITQPWGASFSATMLLPLLAAALVAGRDISTRYISPHQSSLYVAFLTATMVTAGGAVMCLTQWRPVTATALAWIALCALLLSGAYFALITAFRSGELSFVAPLKYVSIVFAIFLGNLLWDESLEPLQLAGVALVVGAGVTIFYRERGRGAGSED